MAGMGAGSAALLTRLAAMLLVAGLRAKGYAVTQVELG